LGINLLDPASIVKVRSGVTLRYKTITDQLLLFITLI